MTHAGHHRHRFTLAAIMKNEAAYLREWVAYHRVIGFDHIIILDNESTDATAAICEQLVATSAIEYRYWPDPPPNSPIGPQVLAYEHTAATTSTEWLCFLDADEFLTLESDRSVAELVGRAGVGGMPIALNWKIFGSSGHITASDALVIQRFQRCGGLQLDVNAHIKTLGPTALLRAGARVHVHGWVLDHPAHFFVDALGERVTVEGHTFVRPPRWRGAWVNHYIVKSLEEFEQKCRRGSATETTRSRHKYSRTFSNYFQQYDHNEHHDSTILRFQNELGTMLSLPNKRGL